MKDPKKVGVTWDSALAQLGLGETALLRLFAWFAPDPIPLFVLDGDEAAEVWKESTALLATERGLKQEVTATPRAAIAKLIIYGLAMPGEDDFIIVDRAVQEILRNRTPETMWKEWITAALRLLQHFHKSYSVLGV